MILLVTAFEPEARVIERVLTSEIWRNVPTKSVCTGMGRERTRNVLANFDGQNFSCALAVGVCGALAESLRVGDVVIPSEVVDQQGERRAPTLTLQNARGILLTSDEVVQTSDERRDLCQKTSALAVDMEASEVLAWAETQSIPAAVIKVVCDDHTESISAMGPQGLNFRSNMKRAFATLEATLLQLGPPKGRR